ncbi:type II toxin-antitoxin system HicA family toxin [Sphingobacteriaceae bacterium WQ 2009]|uniref:Type II toxin-antitoxin system HicA family toxin n=1 Tax=Rhinopithecimicrobium faecis TaxID=2820698 RepID=A0A8T4HDK1_9SPHI|nr:type II toxin-antitoxin system HicA family toxin [Sphingobacteriaceae bacterium WQ 2009]
MKSSEFHRVVKSKGWKHKRSIGSHYIYEKNGRIYSVPYHGAKEVSRGYLKKLSKILDLDLF